MTTETKINSAELMNEEQLKQVAGGTVKELEELVSAWMSNDAARRSVGKFLTHVVGINACSMAAMESDLDRNLGIEADISIGYFGLGIGSEPNKYKDKKTGKSLTHSEVLQRIRNYKG